MMRSVVLLLALLPADARLLQSVLPGPGRALVSTPNSLGVARSPHPRAQVVPSVTPSPAPRGGGTSSQLQIMGMDDAQEVLVDWTQRALLYSQTTDWDLAGAEMTAIEEMQALRKFAVSSDLHSRKFAKLVLGMYVNRTDGGAPDLRGLAALKLGRGVGFVVSNVVVHPAELIDTESTAALRFHVALRAMAEELRMEHSTEGDCVALERGSLDESKISILPMDLWNMPRAVAQLSVDSRPSPSPPPAEAPPTRRTDRARRPEQSLDPRAAAAENFALAEELQAAVEKFATTDVDAKAGDPPKRGDT